MRLLSATTVVALLLCAVRVQAQTDPIAAAATPAPATTTAVTVTPTAAMPTTATSAAATPTTAPSAAATSAAASSTGAAPPVAMATGIGGPEAPAAASVVAPSSEPATAGAAPRAAARPRPSWEQHFAQANASHDGHLTLDQAKLGYQIIARHFREIDLDGKGYVTEDDVRTWHKTQQAQRAARQSTAPQGDQALHPRPAIHRTFKPQATDGTSEPMQPAASPAIPMIAPAHDAMPKLDDPS